MSEGLFALSRSELVEQQGWVNDVVFDNQQELVWVAGQKGCVSSYYSCGLQLYTKFPANNEVTQLLTIDAGILSLSPNQLNLHTRQGRPQLSFTSPNMTGMYCMCAGPSSSEVLLGGQHNKIMTKYDLSKRKVVNEVTIPDSGCVLIKETSNMTCLGSPDGAILLYDKNTYKKISVIEAHSGTISDFDISDNMLVSCGFASRGNDQMTVKRSLLVYDLRMMRSLNAVHCSIDPLQLRFMPMYHSQVLVASQTGQFQQLEVTVAVPQNNKYFEVDLGGNNCYAIDLSSTSKALAIGDTAGMVHLLASQEGTQFNSFSQPTYFPPETILSFPKVVNIDDYSFPLATVPFPHTTEQLLSEWPLEFQIPGDRRPKRLDPEIIRNMKMVKFVGYTPNPNNMYKNTIPYDMTLINRDDLGKRQEDIVTIPRVYHRMDMDPTSLTEMELRNYNRTKFSVLYTTKSNTYICTVLQLLYYMEPIALALKSHICQKTGCLACELGVLFYTLDVTDEKITNADSFIQVFEHLPDTKRLNLFSLDRNSDKKDVLQLPQHLLTFLLRYLDKEMAQHNATSAVFLTFGSKVEQRFTCLSCKTMRNKPTINLTYTLHYPSELNYPSETTISFVELLKRTMQKEVHKADWCNLCRNIKPGCDTTILESLPYILHLNCGMQSTEHITFWEHQIKLHNVALAEQLCSAGKHCNNADCRKTHHTDNNSWLPLNFHITAGNEQGELLFKRGLSADKGDKPVGVFEYELCGVVAHIDASDRSHGLMLHSLVGRGYHIRRGCDDNAWYLFNGCSATGTSDKEGVSFGQSWKTPCVIIYKQVKLPKDLYQVSTPNPIEVFTPFSMIPPGINLVPLSQAEVPTKGELVGIGVELLKDTLVRVVLVRGQGPSEGVPFNHDICPTNYSPEVLQNMNQLTSVKLLYFKIKCLVDRGVILVGHSIAKQLKYLNIHIPAQQYIDTAELYSQKHSNLIPQLQFLCTRILKVENVSGANNDAIFSLQLYEKFLELKRAGQYEKTIKSLQEAM